MPVEKFKSASDMPRPGVVTDEHLIERIRALWNRAFTLCPPSFSRGVSRFRSVELANEAREQQVRERMSRTASALPSPDRPEATGRGRDEGEADRS